MTVAPADITAPLSGPGAAMWVRRHQAQVASIVEAFDRDRIWFGDGPFSGLVTPASVVLSPSVADDVRRSLAAVWEWHRAWQALYSDMLSVEASHPLVRLCEWGLTVEQVAVQRRTARDGALPRMARLDTVTACPRVQVAEAQWKGGGEGFLAGVDATYRNLFPPQGDEGPPGGLTAMWASYYAEVGGGRHVVSVVRPEWVEADRAFASSLAEVGIDVVVATPAEVDANLAVSEGTVTYDLGDAVVEVGALRCDRLADTVTGDRLNGLLACVDDGRLVLDPPPSYLCAEKFGMALPFTDQFRSYFSDAVRECLIPTALVDGTPDCAAVAEALAGHGGEDLLSLAAWDDLVRLPRSLRRRLVVKCGSANPVWNQGGRGVWKLGGPARADEKLWSTVLARVRSGREAWILQPYVDQSWPVDLYHPRAPDDPHACDAHMRLLFYGHRTGEVVRFVGGGANFGPFWKVSGKDARWSAGNRLEGSAFCDLRIAPGAAR